MDAAVVAYFLLDHETAPPYMVTTHPVVLCRGSLHAAKLASHQNPSCFVFLSFVIPRLAIVPTHRTTPNNTAKCLVLGADEYAAGAAAGNAISIYTERRKKRPASRKQS
jgi:hypothetical protein